MKVSSFITLLVIPVLLVSACNSHKELPAVYSLNLENYAGTWYEVARLPYTEPREGCECATLRYITEGDHLQMEKSCYDAAKNEFIRSKGLMRPRKGSNNSRFKIQQIPSLNGDYHILALEEDYSYALVGAPDRKSLWILSRRREPAAEIVKEYLNRAEELGYHTADMIFTRQDCRL